MDLQQPIKLGVDIFLKIFEGQFEILHSGFQLFVEKNDDEME